MSKTQHYMDLAERYGAHNYAPLPVVIERALGVWVTDVEGRRYLDMLSSYSALNFGHNHPKLTEALRQQMERVVVTSRAFYNDQYGAFCKTLCEFTEMGQVLPMNTGAEAVETAIKTSRKWAYEIKQVPADQAEIIAFAGNFHGRTTTIVGFSTDPLAREGFGPFTPGFKMARYGDIDGVERLIADNTAAILVEPIQGEGGIIMPPEGFLVGLRQLCDTHRILLVMDEVQTGLCRTGKRFACQYDEVKPDIYILGKALGGGLLPVSAIASQPDILQVMTPGVHGSTFGGMPLSCAVARRALEVLLEDDLAERAARAGEYMMAKLKTLKHPQIAEVRGRGLLIGVELKRQAGKAKDYCLALMEQGLLCKDTHEQVIRFAPPLIIKEQEIDWALERIDRVFASTAAVASS